MRRAIDARIPVIAIDGAHARSPFRSGCSATRRPFGDFARILAAIMIADSSESGYSAIGASI